MKLVDTAGVREARDLVETLGIERSHQAMADADLTLLVLDLSAELSDEDRMLLEKLRDRKPLLVGNKCDLARRLEGIPDCLPVSAITGEGIAALREACPSTTGAVRPRRPGERQHHQCSPRVSAHGKAS